MKVPYSYDLPLDIPEVCATCHSPLKADCVYLPETAMPGLDLSGNPLRLVGWHKECAPEWAIIKYQHAD